MNTNKTICCLIILFILVTVSIILSIVAITMSNKVTKSKSFAVLEFQGRGTEDYFELSNSTYFNYNVTSDAKLKLAANKGVIAIINNESDYTIQVTTLDDVKLKYKREVVEELLLTSGKCAAIMWSSNDVARIIKL